MSDARQILRDVEIELVAGAAAQRAARAVIARWLREAASHRTRDRVRASLHAREAHELGGPRRQHRIGVVPRPPLPHRFTMRVPHVCAGCSEPVGVTTSCEGGW